MKTNNIKVQDWNAVVSVPDEYDSNPAKKYPTILFSPGLGEVGTNIDRLTANGPAAYIKQGWNGEVDTVKFIVISLQPPKSWPNRLDVKRRIDELKTRYRIGDLFMTGLSMGGSVSLEYSYSYSSEVKAVVGVESVVPSEGTGTDYEGRIHNTYKTPALAGLKFLLFEQKDDWRRNDQVINTVNSWGSGSGTYVYTTFNGGGHCCWNEFYGGGGKQPGKFTEIAGKNLYEWIADRVLESSPLPNLIISFLKKDNVLEFQCENVEVGDHFVISESINGITFKDIATVGAIPGHQFYKVNLN